MSTLNYDPDLNYHKLVRELDPDGSIRRDFFKINKLIFSIYISNAEASVIYNFIIVKNELDKAYFDGARQDEMADMVQGYSEELINILNYKEVAIKEKALTLFVEV